MIYCISLHQPWASLLFVGPNGKLHETRGWPAPARIVGGRLAIHAAKKPPTVDGVVADICAHFFGPDWRESLPRGAILGTVDVHGSRPTDPGLTFGGAQEVVDYFCGDWTPERHFWALENRVPLAAPLPTKGQQGIWKVEL